MQGDVGSYWVVLDYIELDKKSDCNDASHVGGDGGSDDDNHDYNNES